VCFVGTAAMSIKINDLMLLTRVLDVHTATRLHSIISELPDQIQADYADTLNSYAFPIDETTYTQHVLSQLPVGVQQVTTRNP
jgi:hypothetical protein